MKTEESERAYNNLFNPIPFYADKRPFEWDYRSASQSICNINKKQELINIITTIKRSKGHIFIGTTLENIDRVFLDFDINTINENDVYRFYGKSLKAFFNNAIKVRTEIENQLKDKIYG